MIKHYFKIAFRNLLKYKTQNIISVIGLAIGFTCFALANLWIHHEMTYDSAYIGSERMCMLYQKNTLNDSGYSTSMSYPLSTLLKETFPEIEATCAYTRWQENELQAEGQPIIPATSMQGDSCLMNMFGIKVIAGSMEFMYSDDKIALTEEMAIRLFGTTDVLGKEVKTQGSSVTVCAILNGSKHSNLSFDFWEKGAYFQQWKANWQNASFKIIIRLKPGIEFAAFQKKLNANKHKVDLRDLGGIFEDLLLMPLQDYQYSEINNDKSIRFTYLILFSVAGGLVILCSLSNYLSLFVTRMHMRSREVELRRVCGSFGRSLFMLFITEYLLMILASGFVGMTLLEISLPLFRELSKVTGTIYGESLLFFAGVTFLSLLLLIPFIVRRHRSKQQGEQYWLRKSGIVFQLIIGILFMFCMSVLMKQLFFLKNTDLGWDRKNMAVITIYPDDRFEEIGDKIEKMPCAKEVLKGHWGLLPRGTVANMYFTNWDGKQDSVKDISIMTLLEGEALAKFYNLQLLEGEMLKKGERNKAMINETGAKALGMRDPVGKNLYWGLKGETALTICGLIKDFHVSPPTTPVQPILFTGEENISFSFFGSSKGQILIKHHVGKWGELKSKIENLFLKEYPEVRYKLINVEDEYAIYLKSEDALLTLLSFVSGVCVLIAIFGIYSLVTLSCERRRKEIAVRKVNGASITDILTMFAKEYMLLLLTASIIAFPIGYALMKQWLQSYVKQTEISLCIYLSIFGFLAFFIFLSIGWRVWKAARQNPAEVIKSE